MSHKSRYTEQHERILIPVKDILTILDSGGLKDNEQKVSGLLSVFASRLKLHLKTEDNTIYPALLNHSDEKVRAVAKKFKVEMGSISKIFDNYITRWDTHVEIRACREVFTKETREFFAALADRITKEDNELYPLVT